MGRNITGGRVLVNTWPGLARENLENGQDLQGHARPPRHPRRDREEPAGQSESVGGVPGLCADDTRSNKITPCADARPVVRRCATVMRRSTRDRNRDRSRSRACVTRGIDRGLGRRDAGSWVRDRSHVIRTCSLPLNLPLLPRASCGMPPGNTRGRMPPGNTRRGMMPGSTEFVTA